MNNFDDLKTCKLRNAISKKLIYKSKIAKIFQIKYYDKKHQLKIYQIKKILLNKKILFLTN